MSLKNKWNKFCMKFSAVRLLIEFSDWHTDKLVEAKREEYRERDEMRRSTITESSSEIIMRLRDELSGARWEIERLDEDCSNMTISLLNMDHLKEALDDYLVAEGFEAPWAFDLRWRIKVFEDTAKAHREKRKQKDVCCGKC